MKKLFLTILAATSVVAFQASAITVSVENVTGYNAGDGEFNVSPITGTGYGTGANGFGTGSAIYANNEGALGFGTFCIDRSTGITIPGTYDATVIQSGIDPVNGNHISLGTAWLYLQFAQGHLPNYSYVPGPVGDNPPGGPSASDFRSQSAYLLQNAIWVLEGQIGNNISDIFLDMVVGQFGSLAAASADNNQAYSVGVLSLTTLDANGRPTTTHVQSMLTLLPDGGSALLLLGMGLTGLALVSRKVKMLA